jgi:formylmethanofuran dehydrogenase subunit D
MSFIILSGIVLVPQAPVTMGVLRTLTKSTIMPLLRQIATVPKASMSSNPSANKQMIFISDLLAKHMIRYYNTIG